MSRLLRPTIITTCLALSVLGGVGEAVPAPLREAERAQVLTCKAAEPAFADFDQNGVFDRVDSRDASGRAAVSITVNGRQRVTLAEPPVVCGVLALDIDHDADTDLVALTNRDRLLVWRNEDGALRLVQLHENPDAAGPEICLGARARPPDWVVLRGRSLPCRSTSLQIHARPSLVSRIIDGARQPRVARSNHSASRAPPIC